MQRKIGQLEQKELEIDAMKLKIGQFEQKELEIDAIKLKIGQFEQKELEIDVMKLKIGQLEQKELEIDAMKLNIGQLDQQMQLLNEKREHSLKFNRLVDDGVSSSKHHDGMSSSTSSTWDSSVVASDTTSCKQPGMHIPTAPGSHHQASPLTSYNSVLSSFACVSGSTSGATKAETMSAECQDNDDGKDEHLVLYGSDGSKITNRDETARPVDTTFTKETAKTHTKSVYDTEDLGSNHSLQSNDQGKEAVSPSQPRGQISSLTSSSQLSRCSTCSTHDYADPDHEAAPEDAIPTSGMVFAFSATFQTQDSAAVLADSDMSI
eukprot:gene5057-34851_t